MAKERKQLDPSFVKMKVSTLGKSLMTRFSHGYKEGEKIDILEAAKRNTRSYTRHSKKHTAVALMDVILAANRDYIKQVADHVKTMRENTPRLSFTALKKMLDKHDFVSFKKVWGHADEKKFETLKAVLTEILKFKKQYPRLNDFQLVNKWAKKATLANKNYDSIGKLKNIGVATYQHLRMTFGVNTIKPDLRVKQVLEREFGMKLNSEKSIEVAEQIAGIAGLKPLLIDQIFVKYGSGYYRTELEEVKNEVENIIKELIALKVPKNKISKATKWSIDEINGIE